MKLPYLPLMVLVGALATGSFHHAQAKPTLRVIPQVGKTGDILKVVPPDPTLMLGSEWTMTAYSFRMNIGGTGGTIFAGASTTLHSFSIPYIHVFGTTLWAGPLGQPPSDPLGTVTVYSSFGTTVLPFYFTDETGGRVDTIGRGTTLSSGDRAVIQWDIARGDPSSGNASFTPLLDLAPPRTIPLLVLSPPVAEPYTPVGDGDLVVDLAHPYFVLVGSPVRASGESRVRLPIPRLRALGGPGATVGITVHAQWVFLEPSSHELAVSNGLRFTL